MSAPFYAKLGKVRRFSHFLLVFGSAAALLGCDVYDAKLVDQAQAANQCALRRLPSRPAASPAGDQVLVFALRDVILDQRDNRWRDIGYDLDNYDDDRCPLNRARPSSCEPRRQGEAVPRDGNEGIDNLFGGEILPLILAYNANLQTQAQTDQTAGRAAMVVQISGWNGSASSNVRAFLAQTVYGKSTQDPIPLNPVIPPVPRWDGTDEWWVSAANFVDGDVNQPLIVDDAAYVADRVFVMRLPDRSPILFPWVGNRLQLKLTDGALTGRISDDGLRLENVTLSGRWSLIDIAESLTPAGICPNTVPRIVIDDQLEKKADIRSAPATDGLAQPCDAISTALKFTGYRAAFGGVVAPPATGPNPCP